MLFPGILPTCRNRFGEGNILHRIFSEHPENPPWAGQMSLICSSDPEAERSEMGAVPKAGRSPWLAASLKREGRRTDAYHKIPVGLLVTCRTPAAPLQCQNCKPVYAAVNHWCQKSRKQLKPKDSYVYLVISG